MTRILIADDHDLVRKGIISLLKDVAEIEVVGEAKTGEEAVKFAKQLEPCVVLMDVRMPGIGGLEATKRILTSCPGIRVLVVSAHADDLYTERFMKAGALGYVTKDAGFDEMLKAIRSVKNGRMYMTQEVAQQMAMRNISGASSDNPFEQLSERELQTVTMIVQGEKVSKIAEVLFVSPKTVNSYRYRAFEKLNVNSDVELVHLAIKYKLLDPDSEPDM